MARLFEKIKQAVEIERVTPSSHADDRLRERGVMFWQLIGSVHESRLIRERPQAQPNPCVEVEHVLPDGIAVKAVWAWLAYNQSAILVTVHYFDEIP